MVKRLLSIKKLDKMKWHKIDNGRIRGMKKVLKFKQKMWLIAMLLLMTPVFSPTVFAEYPTEVKTAEEIAAVQDVRSYIAIEQTSGKILLEKDANEIRGIASMSKMISQYLVLEALKNGEISWETPIPISDRVSTLSVEAGLSNVPLWLTQTYAVRELLEASSIFSANAATIALAEYLAGSEVEFSKWMQAKVESWGITDATLVNATGLPNYYGGSEANPQFPADAENQMSAQSVAQVAQRLVVDFPEILKISSVPKQEFHPGKPGAVMMTNYNYLLPGLMFEYEGVTGLKTGTTDLSGASITTTATRNGFSVILVTMGSKEPLNRFKVAAYLLDEIFKKYEGLVVGIPGKSVQNAVAYPVANGSEETLHMDYGETFVAAVPKGTARSQINIRFEPLSELLNESGELQAPITAGQTVGNLYMEVPGENLGYVDGSREGKVPALASYDITTSNVMTEGYRSIRGFFKESWNHIATFFVKIKNAIQNIFFIQ